MSDDINKRVKHIQQKLGAEVKDEYYANVESRLDTVLGSLAQRWNSIRLVKREYDALADAVPLGQGFLTFYDYVKEYYGIKMMMIDDNLSPNYEIIDEKKYTVFLLKFANGN